MATSPNRPKGRSIKNLRMVWSFASRYPGHIAVAALALLVAAARDVGRALRIQADHRQRLRGRRRHHAATSRAGSNICCCWSA